MKTVFCQSREFFSLSTEYCPPGWEYFQGSCYFFSSSLMSWDDSQSYCQQSSANLVNIGSVEENEFVFNTNALIKRWIGLRDIANNQFNWIDDGTEPVYVIWTDGFPTDDLQDCAMIRTRGWRTKSCSINFQFICEKG